MEGHAEWNGDLTCEITAKSPSTDDLKQYRHYCLNVSDLIMIFNWNAPQYNPPRLNMYTVKRLFYTDAKWSIKDRFPNAQGSLRDIENERERDLTLTYMRPQITVDISTNWAISTVNAEPYHIYKFFPHVDSTYPYVTPCSNHGVCDDTVGLCKCLRHYRGDACEVRLEVGAL